MRNLRRLFGVAIGSRLGLARLAVIAFAILIRSQKNRSQANVKKNIPSIDNVKRIEEDEMSSFEIMQRKKLFSSLDQTADARLSIKEISWAIQRRMGQHQQK